MLREIKYSKLKQNKIQYRIMLLHDSGHTFADIARKLQKSASWIALIYNQIKLKQGRMYCKHLADIDGDQNIKKYFQLWSNAIECYCDLQSSVAYFEKVYYNELKEFRAGEPGMPYQFLEKLPPIKECDEKITQKVVQMRDGQNKTFIEIGRLLDITQHKAKKLYDQYYHWKSYLIIEQIKEKRGIEYAEPYLDLIISPKRCFDTLRKNYPELYIDNS